MLGQTSVANRLKAYHALEKKTLISNMNGEKAELITQLENEKEHLRVSTDQCAQKDELRLRELFRCESDMQLMREKSASCESAMELLGRECNLGLIHSTIKWVTDSDWWAMSPFFKLCLLDC